MRIAEASARYGLSPATLRYYERAGLLRHVSRGENGIRDYDEEACRAIEFVKCMRGAGVSVEALARYMELCEQGESTAAARKALLEDQREQLQARIDTLQAGLDRLDYKIANYDSLMAPGGAACKGQS